LLLTRPSASSGTNPYTVIPPPPHPVIPTDQREWRNPQLLLLTRPSTSSGSPHPLSFRHFPSHCYSDRPTGAEEPAVAFPNLAKMIAITAQPQPPNYLSRMDERVYSVYIVASRSRTLYIGVTGDLRRRIFQHKWKEYEGFSAKYNCDRLVWFESYQDISAAISRETQLKKWNRAKKLTLIERMNTAWLDLSRDWYECEPADYKRATDGLQS
jgi:putative endonuclease